MADQQQQTVEQVEATGDPLVDAIMQRTSQQEPAAEAPVDPPADDDLTIQQRQDGKFQLGRYVGDTIEDVAKAAAKGQREAHAELTRLQQQAKEQPPVDPFAFEEDEADDWDYEPQDPTAGIRARRFIKNVINDPYSDDGDYEQAAVAALQIGDERLFEAALKEWGDVNQAGMLGFRQRVEQAAQQVAAQQQQSYEAQQRQAFTAAQQAFVQQTPDWQQYDAAASEFLRANPYIMQAAYQTGDPRAVYQAFTTAFEYAKAQHGVAPVAQTQVIEQAKDDLHIETGGDGGGDLFAGSNDDAVAAKKKALLAAMQEGSR